MRVDDGAKLGRRRELVDERGRRVRRDREDDRVILDKRDAVTAEIERRDTVAGKAEGAELMAEAKLGPTLGDIVERRLDQGRAQTFPGDERPAGSATRAQRLAEYCAGELGGAERRIDVQSREQQGLDQSLIEHAFGGDDGADRFPGRRK